jgi:hypothetical protein
VTVETPWEHKSRRNQSKIEIVSVERELFDELFGTAISIAVSRDEPKWTAVPFTMTNVKIDQ